MWPMERSEGPRIRIAPSMSMFSYGKWDPHFGELLQGVYEAAPDSGMSVIFDTDQHPRRGEVRAGAAPLEAIKIVIETLGAFRAAWEVSDLIFARLVPWIRRHRGASQEAVSVEILGSDGEVIKSVLVEPDAIRDWPPPA